MVESASVVSRPNFGSSRTLAKGNKDNKAIRKVYKYRKGFQAKKSTLNKKAIGVLAKQVKTLQLQRFGSVQWQSQFTSLNSAIVTAFPQKSNPVCFALNNFYNNANLYRGEVTPTPPLGGVASGVTLPTNLAWRKQDFDVDLNHEYQWLAINNQEIVSKTQYLPIKTKLQINFDALIHQTQRDPLRFRVTIFSIKKQPGNRKAPAALMAIPQDLGAYWNLAAPLFKDKNYFSKIRHKIYHDRWITFYPPSATGSVSSLSKSFNYTHYFDEEPLNRDYQNEPPGSTFLDAIPEDEVIWCMISGSKDNLHLDDSVVNINMARVNTFRDKKGVSII